MAPSIFSPTQPPFHSSGILTYFANLVLIESKAGFQNEKDQYWNAGDDLDAHKKDFVVRSRRSVGREDTSSIKAEDYKLKFEKSSAEGEHTLDLVAAFPKAEPARERPDPDPVQPPVELDPQPAKPKPIDWTPVKPVRSAAAADTDALMRSSAASFATMAVTSDLFVDTVLRSDDARRNGIFAAARAGTYGFDVKPRLSADVYVGLVGIGGTLGETDLGASSKWAGPTIGPSRRMRTGPANTTSPRSVSSRCTNCRSRG